MGQGHVVKHFGAAASEAAIAAVISSERALPALPQQHATLRAEANKAIERRRSSVADHCGDASSFRHLHRAIFASARPFPFILQPLEKNLFRGGDRVD